MVDAVCAVALVCALLGFFASLMGPN